MRSFETLIAGQKNLEAEQKNLAIRLERVESNIVVLVDTAKDHKAAIEMLASRIEQLEVGQQQIIALLTGRSPLHD